MQTAPLILLLVLGITTATAADVVARKLGDDAAAAKAVRARVVDSLLCRNEKGDGESLDALRALKPGSAQLQRNGMRYQTQGEEMDERISIDFDPPLDVLGQPTPRVTMAVDGAPYENFGALIWAEFSGSPTAAIARFQLQPGKPDAAIAPYVRSIGNLKATCPAQLGLKQLGPDRYLLGCGWCNG